MQDHRSDSSPPAQAEWLAHRYDSVGDRVQFVEVPRARHAEIPFLTDAHLPQAKTPFVMTRLQAMTQAQPPGPIHFIFHSAFCCSTLLVRALDLPGVSMGLSEPVVLNDIVGWRHRSRPEGARVAMVLDQMLSLLARPFAPDEAIVVKPSNLINPLMPAILALKADSRALLLHAPLEDYLGSIARKEVEGRYWVRDLFVKLRREGFPSLGIEGDDLLRLTDLQVAAVGWLMQHSQFAAIATRYPERVATIDSETLMNRRTEAFGALGRLFGLSLDAEAVANGPIFQRHSKSGASFDAESRREEQQQGKALHAREIATVLNWADQLARAHGISWRLPHPLIGA